MLEQPRPKLLLAAAADEMFMTFRAAPFAPRALPQPAGRPLEGGGVASGGLRDMIPTIARTGASGHQQRVEGECLAAGGRIPVMACCRFRHAALPHVMIGRQRWDRVFGPSDDRFHGFLSSAVPTAAVACGVDGLFMEVHDDPTDRTSVV